MNSDVLDTHKTIIVTGASQGIGAGAVRAFLDRGYQVVANSRNITRSGAFEPSNRHSHKSYEWSMRAVGSALNK
jgi:NAD(P)-dependent dehydrogenase (short-subunit alcohol dehydrogenase family)